MILINLKSNFLGFGSCLIEILQFEGGLGALLGGGERMHDERLHPAGICGAGDEQGQVGVGLCTRGLLDQQSWADVGVDCALGGQRALTNTTNTKLSTLLVKCEENEKIEET